MKKIIIFAVIVFTAVIIEAKLPFNIELMVVNAIPCDDTSSSVSSTGSIVSGDPFAAYAPFIVGMSDCEALIFIINHIIIGSLAFPRPTKINYLYVKYYKKLNGNFDYCDLGFYLDSTTNIFEALVALTFANFTGSSMIYSIWQNMFLCGSNFSHVNATGANFSGVVAPGIIFCYANLQGVNFTHAYMPQSYFNSLPNTTPTNVSGANFNQAVLFKTNFKNAKLKSTRFFFSDMDKVNLHGADCTQATFNNCFGTFRVSPTTNFTQARFNEVDRIYFDIPEGQSPIFSETLMPDGTICSGPECVKYFRRVESELPSVGV